MPVDTGVRFGGTLLVSPSAMPEATEFLTVSSTGAMASQVISESDISDLGTYQPTSEKGQADGYASLDSGGKIPASELPAIAITEYLGEAANEAAMLALDGQEGDWAVRTDLGTVWIITGDDPSDVGDWTELSYPTAPVTSVAGKTGVVTLAAGDIASGTFNDSRIAESNVTQHQAALSITESQISDLGSYLEASDLTAGTLAASLTTLTLLERSSDPSDPAEGSCIIWMSDGTGIGDDGDILMKITAGGNTHTVTLVDFSAAA